MDEYLNTLKQALNERARYILAFQSALAVIGCDAVEIDELSAMAEKCQFEELNRRMVDKRTGLDSGYVLMPRIPNDEIIKLFEGRPLNQLSEGRRLKTLNDYSKMLEVGGRMVDKLGTKAHDQVLPPINRSGDSDYD